jgi:hypothetical protein
MRERQEMAECTCDNCKNYFMVPFVEGIGELNFPQWCCFCGLEFEFILEVEE